MADKDKKARFHRFSCYDAAVRVWVSNLDSCQQCEPPMQYYPDAAWTPASQSLYTPDRLHGHVVPYPFSAHICIGGWELEFTLTKNVSAAKMAKIGTLGKHELSTGFRTGLGQLITWARTSMWPSPFVSVLTDMKVVVFVHCERANVVLSPFVTLRDSLTMLVRVVALYTQSCRQA